MSVEDIYTAAKEHPAKTAIVYNGTAISYRTFANEIATTARFLESQQLPRGDTVVVIVENLLDCWAIVLALQAMGVNTVCVASSAILNTLALKHVAGIATTARESSKHRLESDAGTGKRIITVPNPLYDNTAAAVAPHLPNSVEIGGHILYTSGTTGNYKKIFLAAELEQRRAAELMASHNYNADTFYHCAMFGLWTGAGYKVPQTVWRANGCVLFDQRPDWYRHFLEIGVTDAFLIPDMVSKLLGALDERPESKAPMTFRLTIAGGFLSRELAAKVLERVTLNLINLYGSTEINATSLESKVSDLDDLHWLSATGLRTVEIVDEAGKLCPIDVEGQLRVRLTELDCSSYLDDVSATQKVFRSVYFYPGDMAVRRADGRIRILGRSADTINLRGQKVAVAPMEYEIQSRMGVENVCLFSGINNAGEEEVVIAIESERWPEKSDLNNLGYEFAQFDQVRFALVYPFPRTATGTSKIDRIALRKLVFPVQ